MHNPARAQDLEEQFTQFKCEAELRIERVKIESVENPQ